jgi:hypothetical protein
LQLATGLNSEPQNIDIRFFRVSLSIKLAASAAGLTPDT